MDNSGRPIVAVITAVASQSAQKELMLGIIEQAKAFGYDTAVFSNIYNMSQENENLICEQRIFDLILSDQIAAVILDSEAFVSHSLIKYISKLIMKKNTPVILVGEQLPDFSNPAFFCINTNDCYDLELLTNHLIEVHKFSKIDILTGPKKNQISENRLEGYRKSLIRHGLFPEDNNYFYGDFWLTSGENLANRYISGELELPEAIVCANDRMAFGMLRTFKHSNIKVPDDVAVVAYELSERRIFFSPLLTVYRRNRRSLGKKAVMLINSLLNNTQLPDINSPPGELICGESCHCHADAGVTYDQLENELDMKDYERYVVFSTMEQKLTAAKNPDEFAAIMGEFQWMIRNVQSVYLCLYIDWYDINPASSLISCRNIIPLPDSCSFEAHKYDFAAIFHREEHPAVYYFTPVFFGTRLFGHLVLRYNKPDSYDEAFRTWTKSVSTCLEFLRMKNDIKYLLSCQDLSNSRDTLTGMLNRNGIRHAYKNVVVNDSKALCFIILRVCINVTSSFTSEVDQKVKALISASKAVQEFCGCNDICGYMGDHTFVCIVQSNAGIELLCSTLISIMIQHKEYMDLFGINSVFCTGELCSDLDFESLFDTCLNRAKSYKHHLEINYSMPHYNEMLTLRNSIYTCPELTFGDGLMKLYTGNLNSMRVMYKKCFGISFHQDCINARISKAKYYLAVTSMSLTDTAEKCGFLDHKYFQRQFTASVGITAKHYRDLMKT
ncbi:MAG: substrate-binding domain-containing protein [Oscillospiraceae bacterium]|nr:substrate-binding domain-containing protein [Oscillospiraceae bacterium]